MALGKNIANGFAWVGLALVIGVPAADMATSRFTNSDTVHTERLSTAALETPVVQKPQSSNPLANPVTTVAQVPAGNLTTPAKPVPSNATPAPTLVLPGSRPLPFAPAPAQPVPAARPAPPVPVAVTPAPSVIPQDTSPTTLRTQAAPLPRPATRRAPVEARNEEIYIPPEVTLERRRPEPRFAVPPSQYLPPLGFEERVPDRQVLRPVAPPNMWADEYEYGNVDRGYGYVPPEPVYVEPYDEYGYDNGGRDILIGPVEDYSGGSILEELFR